MVPEETVDLHQPGTQPDVLALLSQVERSIGLLRARAGDEVGRAAEAHRLARECALLEEERARLLERQCLLESQLASARGTLSEFERRVREAEARAGDADRRAKDACEECARIEGEALSLALARDEEIRLAAETQRAARAEAHDKLQSAYEARVVELERDLAETRDGLLAAAEKLTAFAASAEMQARRAQALEERLADAERLAQMSEADARRRIEAAEAARDALQGRFAEDATATRGAADAAAAEAAQLRTARDELARRVEAMEADRADLAHRLAVESAARVAAETDRLEPDGAGAAAMAAPLDEAAQSAAIESRASEIAAARVQDMLAPKLAGLAQAASFLRTRRMRLAALHAGLKRRMRELRGERAAFACDAAASAGAPSAYFPSTQSAPEASVGGSAETLTAMRVEREAMANERQELIDLRAVLEASESALARRAAGTRLSTAVAFALATVAIAAAASWHLAGALAPAPARAMVELAVTSRTPEGVRMASGDDPTADAAVAAAPIAAWIRDRAADERFAGAVAGRLLDRGRTRAESDALAVDLADRLSISDEGSTIRMTITAPSADDAVATLDSIATSAVTEVNRDPARRSDYLRVGIANAKQEIGRTVFSRAEPLSDGSRVGRAGGIFGGFLVFAAAVGGFLMLMTRRASALATQGY